MATLDADVVVVGVGSVGSMASWQLAARGLRVIGVDRFSVPGPFSAYAGESRVFRTVSCRGRALHAGAASSARSVADALRTGDEQIVASRVLVCSGTGAGQVCEALGTRLAVLPQVLTWFPAIDPSAYGSDKLPVFLRRSRNARFYGFPSADGWTVKVAASIYLDEVESMARPVSWDPHHLDTVRSWVKEFLPDLVPEPVRAVVCADGYTVDETGLLGPVPGMDGVVVAVGFSGHGFKMASALGAIAADLMAEGSSETDVSFMDPSRFLGPGKTLTSLPLG